MYSVDAKYVSFTLNKVQMLDTCILLEVVKQLKCVGREAVFIGYILFTCLSLLFCQVDALTTKRGN